VLDRVHLIRAFGIEEAYGALAGIHAVLLVSAVVPWTKLEFVVAKDRWCIDRIKRQR